MAEGSGEDAPTPETTEMYSSWALTILCILLILALWTSYFLQVRRIKAVHETVVSIFAGMVVGLTLRLAPGHMLREMLTFKHTFFFNLLLPPIILNSGYELKQEQFFRNFGVILTFAFVGTFISAVGLGVLVYLWSFTGLEGLKFTLLECLIFGSTLSATDPVTILSIFKSYKVDPKLYSIIFGESLLNDAVSIVLYETLSQFHGEDIFISSFFHGIAIFLLQFSTSMALGVMFGLGCSLMLKHSQLSLYPGIESCIITLIAFTSYFFSTGLHMSGIVSLLFCGITLKHYAYHSMSRKTQRTTKYMFNILAQLSENFIFIYLGLNLFTADVQVFKPLFILISVISVMAARYAAVFPLSEIINWIYHARGQRHEELPHSYQMMLFWAGLRGAVGVALAVGIKGENADALRTTVLVVVVLTVIVFGGTTARMLEVLGIKVGVEEEDDSSDDENWATMGGSVALQVGPGSRRYIAGQNGRSISHHDGGGHPFADSEEALGYIGSGEGAIRGTNSFNRGAPPPRSATITRAFSGLSSSSSDSEEGEILPSSAAGFTQDFGDGSGTNADASGSGSRDGMVFRDGQWFTALDERYLLPLFSNSVASRRHHAKRAHKRAISGRGPSGDDLAGQGSGVNSPGSLMDGDDGEEDIAEEADSENGKRWKPRGSGFTGSVNDFFHGVAQQQGSASSQRGSPSTDPLRSSTPTQK